MATLTGTPEYQAYVRQLESTDPSAPLTWNPNYLVLINNDAFLRSRSEGAGLFGDGFLLSAGSVVYGYDVQNRISKASCKDASAVTVATVTVVYDDTNGGRINYVEAVIAGPPAMTVRNTCQYDESGGITGIERTVS